jgi:hypothetical protein
MGENVTFYNQQTGKNYTLYIQQVGKMSHLKISKWEKMPQSKIVFPFYFCNIPLSSFSSRLYM